MLHAGKACILLSNQVDRKTKQESAGIMIWVNENELVLVDRIKDETLKKFNPRNTIKYRLGLSSIERISKHLDLSK